MKNIKGKKTKEGKKLINNKKEKKLKLGHKLNKILSTKTKRKPDEDNNNSTTNKKNQKIKFELWDTAGEEKYRAIARVFYQNSSVCILVYDITRKASFDEIKNFWINEIKQHLQDNASKIIFKNKINFNYFSLCIGRK